MAYSYAGDETHCLEELLQASNMEYNGNMIIPRAALLTPSSIVPFMSNVCCICYSNTANQYVHLSDSFINASPLPLMPTNQSNSMCSACVGMLGLNSVLQQQQQQQQQQQNFNNVLVNANYYQQHELDSANGGNNSLMNIGLSNYCDHGHEQSQQMIGAAFMPFGNGTATGQPYTNVTSFVGGGTGMQATREYEFANQQLANDLSDVEISDIFSLNEITVSDEDITFIANSLDLNEAPVVILDSSGSESSCSSASGSTSNRNSLELIDNNSSSVHSISSASDGSSSTNGSNMNIESEYSLSPQLSHRLTASVSVNGIADVPNRRCYLNNGAQPLIVGQSGNGDRNGLLSKEEADDDEHNMRSETDRLPLRSGQYRATAPPELAEDNSEMGAVEQKLQQNTLQPLLSPMAVNKLEINDVWSEAADAASERGNFEENDRYTILNHPVADEEWSSSVAVTDRRSDYEWPTASSMSSSSTTGALLIAEQRNSLKLTEHPSTLKFEAIDEQVHDDASTDRWSYDDAQLASVEQLQTFAVDSNNRSTAVVQKRRGRPRKKLVADTISGGVFGSDHRKPRGRPKGVLNRIRYSVSNATPGAAAKIEHMVCSLCNSVYDNSVNLIQHFIVEHQSEDGSFQCGYCTVRAANIDELVYHVDNHNEETQKKLKIVYLCAICSGEYNSNDPCYALADYHTHLKEKHALFSETVNNGCSLCDQMILGMKNFTEHVIDRHFEGARCPICQSDLPSSDAVYSHISEHYGRDNGQERCPFCKRDFCAYDLTAHIATSHSVYRLYLKPKYFRCVLCDSGFSSLNKLTKHVCSKLDESVCSVCQTSFPSKKRLAFHLMSHLQDFAFKLRCDVCYQSFDDETTCYNHIRFTHESETLTCDRCGVVFKTRVGLLIHQQYHTGERNYPCAVCKKSFYNNTTLREHEVTHMSVKPHVCHICGMSLSRPSRLRVHLRAHSIVSSKNVQVCRLCNYCGFATPFNETNDQQPSKHLCLKSVFPKLNGPERSKFEQEIGLSSVYSSDHHHHHHHQQQQQQQQSEVMRSLADDDTARDSGVAVLQSTVTLKVVYMCEFCSNCFANQLKLNLHMKYLHTHTDPNDMPYVCNQCDTPFSTYSRLATHRLSHGITTETYIVPDSNAVAYKNTNEFVIPRVYSCEICFKTYNQYTAFNYHRKFGKHKSKQLDGRKLLSHDCGICGKLFVNQKKLESHQIRFHNDVDDEPNRRFSVNIKSKIAAVSMMFKKSSSRGRKPLRQRNGNSSRTVDDESSSSSSAAAATSSSSSPLLKCDHCDKTFSHKAAFARHSKAVQSNTASASGRRFGCRYCDKTFAQRGYRDIHERKHSNDNANNSHQQQRPDNARSSRSTVLIVQCEHCDYTCTSTNELEAHAKSHAVNYYRCQQCSKRFKLESSLRRHLQKHAEDNKENLSPSRYDLSDDGHLYGPDKCCPVCLHDCNAANGFHDHMNAGHQAISAVDQWTL